jgi:hypothetical protein
MVRTLAVIALAASLSYTQSAACDEGVDMTCHGQMLHGSWALLADAGYGSRREERAAFVIRKDDGSLAFVRWPFESASHRASFSGAAPRGLVAVVHTHPPNSPLPSPGDAGVARRLGVPVYVLTRTLVTRTTGLRTEHVWSGDWNPDRFLSRCRTAPIQ